MRQQAESKREPKNQKQQQQQLENLDLHSIQSQTEKQTEREGASGSGGGERWVVGREKGIGRRSKANMREERQSWVLHRLTKLRGRRHYQQGAHLHVCVSGGAATACVCVWGLGTPRSQGILQENYRNPYENYNYWGIHKEKM